MRNGFGIITCDDIWHIHIGVLERYGGSHGPGAVRLKNLNALKDILKRINPAYRENNDFPTTHNKTAALCFTIIQSQVFYDKNETTAYYAAKKMLELNGLRLDADEGAFEKRTDSIRKGLLEISEMSDWLDKNSSFASTRAV